MLELMNRNMQNKNNWKRLILIFMCVIADAYNSTDHWKKLFLILRSYVSAFRIEINSLSQW